MNLEELKGEWKAHQDKLTPISPLKSGMIAGIISKRSETVTSKISKFYVNGILFCSFYILALSLFAWSSDEVDFLSQRKIIWLSALFLALVVLGMGWLRTRKINPEQNVLNYLEKVVGHYVLALRILTGLVALTLGTLLIVLPSFKLSENIASHGLLWGILDTYELFIVVFIIQSLGRFIPKDYLWSKPGDTYNLAQVKRELKELRELTAELKEDQP